MSGDDDEYLRDPLRPRGRYGEARPDDLVAKVEDALGKREVKRLLSLEDSGHPSGMMARFLADHYRGDQARGFKDITQAPFNDVGIEDAKLWGDSQVLQFNQAGAVTITRQGTQLKVFRSRPTSFTLFYSFLLVSPVWANETGNSVVTVVWQIGVGLTKTLLARPITFTGAAFLDGVTTSLSDTITVPVMGATASVSLTCPNSQANIPHVAIATVLASPYVQ